MSTSEQVETELGRAAKTCGKAVGELVRALFAEGGPLPGSGYFLPTAAIVSTMIAAFVDLKAPYRLVGQADRLVKCDLSPAVKEKAFAVRAAARSWAMLQTVADETPAEQAAEETIDTEK